MAKKKTTAAKKKTVAKAAPAKKAVAKAKKPVTTAIKEPMSKSQIMAHIAETTDVSKKDVAAVVTELTNLIERHVKKNAAGEFKMPGLLKIKVVRKPATKARKGINPFTGEETVFKAKPARNVVKIVPLKALKDMV